MRRRWLVLALWLLARAALAQSPVTVTIEPQPSGYEIPQGFTGLSFETLTLRPDRAGEHFFSGTNTPLITLFRNVGLKSLRIGSATVDMARVQTPSQEDIDQLFSFAQAAGVKVIYSVRLLNGNSQADASLASYIWNHYRAQLDCFAIGNEPDWKSYHKLDSSITNFSSYLADWQRFASTILQAAPGATFCGPDTGGNVLTGPPDSGPGLAWTTNFALAEAGSGRLAAIAQHHYVGDGAGRLTAGQAIDEMLSPEWNSGSNQTLFAVMASPALRCGLPYRFTEANDFAGGVTNASNAFASALWALDFLHWWAAHGAGGVNFHNKRWIPTDTILPDAMGQLCIYPKGYGLKAFEAGSHGRVQALTMNNPGGLNLTAYAVGDRTNLYLTLINKEHGTGARAAAVTLVSRGLTLGTAAALFLTAPKGDVAATGGVTLGGATIANNVLWQGQWTALGSVTNGQCTVAVGVGSAVVVKLTRNGAPAR